MRVDQIKKLPHSKGNNDPGDEAVYRMGAKLCKLLVEQGINIQNV
jgi:hypothetical protein